LSKTKSPISPRKKKNKSNLSKKNLTYLKEVEIVIVKLKKREVVRPLTVAQRHLSSALSATLTLNSLTKTTTMKSDSKSKPQK
jgi:hypothetical protein